MGLLADINSPTDLKRLDQQQLTQLASEVRAFLVEQIAKTGGHLSPNLGVVELTFALHRVFDSPKDAIVWDTGHQAYVHKMATCRSSVWTLVTKVSRTTSRGCCVICRWWARPPTRRPIASRKDSSSCCSHQRSSSRWASSTPDWSTGTTRQRSRRCCAGRPAC